MNCCRRGTSDLESQTPGNSRKLGNGVKGLILLTIAGLLALGVILSTQQSSDSEPRSIGNALPVQETIAPTSSTVPTFAPTTDDTSTTGTTDSPTGPPTGNPTISTTPTSNSIQSPTAVPTETQTQQPTEKPTQTPTLSLSPTDAPSNKPTAPTDVPSQNPTADVPSQNPTADVPSQNPTADVPSQNPTADAPSKNPTASPTEAPSKTMSPTDAPSKLPSSLPTVSPTAPTKQPSTSPTHVPTTSTPTTPTPPPTSIVTILEDCSKLDVIFVVDESDSIDGAEFATMLTFVEGMVDGLFDSGIQDINYGMTLFNDVVRTEVILGDGTQSINDDDFKTFVNGLVQAPGGFTCTAGGLQAALRANFGQLNTDGTIDPFDTKLRENVPTVFFVITDGYPTFFPSNTEQCNVADGDCQCGTTAKEHNSADIFSKIKKASVAPYNNYVFTLGVGNEVNHEFLTDISDVYINTAALNAETVNNVVNTITATVECSSIIITEECAKFDVVFVVDESDSIDGAEFATMIKFVKDIVADFAVTFSDDVDYALTLFSDAVRTEVIIGNGTKSTHNADFQTFMDNIVQMEPGFTCTAGGMQAAFRANFGPLKDDGTVDPEKTNLRAGVPTIVFLITDGFSTVYPSDPDHCDTAHGDCQCGTTNSATDSGSVYSKIKKADVAPYNNYVIALGVGDTVNQDFLELISDHYLNAAELNGNAVQAVRNQVIQDVKCLNAPIEPPVIVEESCDSSAEIMFLLDESSSISRQQFASMITFVNGIVDDIENDFRTDANVFRYGLTLFSDVGRTLVPVGDRTISTSGQVFLGFINDIEQASHDATCVAGGLQTAFGENYGTTDSNGQLQDGVTNLRKNVQSLIFVITDGLATNPATDECVGEDGDCQCISSNGAVESASIYEQFKLADTEAFPNRVVALGVGETVDSAFLSSISDFYFNADEFDSPALNDVREFIKSALTCEDEEISSPTPSPTSAPTVGVTRWKA